MAKALIKMMYKQVIDATKKNTFEKNVLDVSYSEFLLKSQTYNIERKFTTFNQMTDNDGRANSLHYKTGFAVDGLIHKLKNKIPGLKDSLGITDILFEKYQFRILESDTTNKQVHKVAIIYLTDTMTLFDIIGENLVLANGDCSTTHDEFASTFVLKMQPELSIFQWAEVVNGEWSMVSESKNL